MQPSLFKPLNIQNLNAIAQCDRCHQIMSYDYIDSITSRKLIHGVETGTGTVEGCGGTWKLFMEARREID